MEDSQTQTQPTRLRFWEMLAGTFISPSDTLSQIAQQRPVGAALGFIILLEIVGYALSVVLPNKEMVELGITTQKEFSITSMIWGIVRILLAFMIFVALGHGMIRLFKDEGSYQGAFCALAFAWAPIILLYLLNVLASFSYQPLWPWPSTLTNLSSTEIFSVLLAILLIIWTVTLGVMAIRAHYRIKVMGAVVVYILAAIADGLVFKAIEKLFGFLK